ncbi:hypothetical protein Tco_1390908, partial [Tanacetum coccineum]
EVTEEEGFASTMRRCCSDVVEWIVKCRKLIMKLEGLANGGLYVGCLDCLRSNQMKDVEKLRLLNGMVVDSEAVVREKEEYAIDIDGY